MNPASASVKALTSLWACPSWCGCRNTCTPLEKYVTSWNAIGIMYPLKFVRGEYCPEGGIERWCVGKWGRSGRPHRLQHRHPTDPPLICFCKRKEKLKERRKNHKKHFCIKKIKAQGFISYKLLPPRWFGPCLFWWQRQDFFWVGGTSFCTVWAWSRSDVVLVCIALG